MADAEQSNKTTPTPQRRPYHQNRPSYSNRGRGRPDPHVSKALHNFGVTDLREWLDKKHQQEEQSGKGSGPPPDPSYSYLKDPLRDNAHSDDQARRYKEHSERVFDHRTRGNSSRGFRGRRGGGNRDDKRPETENLSYIENPVNIKVELTTATGARSYKVDEETKLADIKHVPDRKQQERRSFRGERDRGGSDGNRGRFQGRGESRGRGESGRGRGELSRGRGDWGRGRGEWGRGRGESGRSRGEWSRGRGRGEWGRGRGRGSRGKYNSREKEYLPQSQPTTEVPTEENWDKECVDQVQAQVESETVGNDVEEVNPEEYYEESDYTHDYEGDYQEEGEGYDYSVSTDESQPTEESEGASGVGLEKNSLTPTEGSGGTGLALEENLVIVTDKHEEKRTVRFKLEEEGKGKDETKTIDKQVNVDENLENLEGSMDKLEIKATNEDDDSKINALVEKEKEVTEKVAESKE